jgi:hypothetical protein
MPFTLPSRKTDSFSSLSTNQTCGVLGLAFYTVLFFIWHVPSLTVQFSFHWMLGVNKTVFGLLVPMAQFEEDINSKRLEEMLLRPKSKASN